MKFLSDGAASYNFAALEYQRFESTSGQIKRGNERVVAAADENYTLSDGHVQLDSLAERALAGAVGAGATATRGPCTPLDCR